MSDKLIIALSIALISFFLGGYAHYKWVEGDKVKQMEAIVAESIKNAEVIRNLEVENANAKKAIDTVMSVKPPPVRLPHLACPDKEPSPSTGIPAIQVGWLLSRRTEQVLAEDRQRTQGIIGACELERADLLVVQKWAKTQ
jgi:hypothetical protein